MTTKKIQFKTTINCNGCIAAVTPYLNSLKNIKAWHVDTANPDKVLTIETENAETSEIIEIVEKAGFKIEALN